MSSRDEIQKGLFELLQGLYKLPPEKPDATVAMHPHNNCSVCQGNAPAVQQLHQDTQILALVECMRTSASMTWEALDRKGYEIVKKPG